MAELGGAVMIQPRQMQPTADFLDDTTLEAIAEPIDITDYVKLMQDQPKRGKLVSPSPKHCEIDHIPTDIGKFLVDMLPSIRAVAAAGAKMSLRDPEVDAIINDFTVYFLGWTDKYATDRWRLYDDTRKPRPKYNLWLLTYVQFFCKSYLSQKTRQLKEIGIQDWDRAEGEQVDAGRIHYSQVEKFIDPEAQGMSPEERLAEREIIDFYERAARHLADLQSVYRNLNPPSWQAHALHIFNAMRDGRTLTELKDDFKISRTSMNKWAQNVMSEVRKNLGENPFSEQAHR